MSINTTTWETEPHTETKHFILKRYLEAWLPIMSQTNSRIIFIDGFAGPGEYIGGEEGSPLIALKSVLEHKLELKSEFIFLFIEKDKSRCDNLREVISKLEIPPKAKIKLNVECGEFKKIITDLLDNLEKENKHLAPTFMFVDPFGFSGVPLEQIKRFMKNKKCEILITFMSEDLIRWCKLPQNKGNINELFGTEEWQKIINNQRLSSKEKLFSLYNLYSNQLKKIGEIKFVRSFEMINKFNKTDYFLFFGTNHILGLERMKESMWVADPNGRFTFSDATHNPQQSVLFSPTPNYLLLKREILDEFKGKKISIEELQNFVITKTEFLRKHIRKPLLDKMEQSGEIEIFCSEKRRSGTYPIDSIIYFK